MTTKQFIEKAIEGGWRNDLRHVGFEIDHKNIIVEHIEHGDVVKEWFSVSEILLDPLAWQAVGKVEGWSANLDKAGDEFTPQYSNCVPYEWPWQMHCLIDALAEGKTIEEFLKTL